MPYPHEESDTPNIRIREIRCERDRIVFEFLLTPGNLAIPIHILESALPDPNTGVIQNAWTELREVLRSWDRVVEYKNNPNRWLRREPPPASGR